MEPQEVLRDAESSVKGRRRSEAVEQINYLIESNALLGEGWLKVAHMALAIGESNSARQAADRYYRASGKTVDAAIKAAGIVAETGHLNDALKYVEKAARKDQANPALYHIVGTIKAQLGQLTEARENLSKVLSLSPHLGITWYTLASITDFSRVDAVYKKLVAAEQSIADKSDQNYALYCYAKAKAFADKGDYDAAERAINAGAKLFMHQQPFDIERNRQVVDKIIAANAADKLTQLPSSNTDTQRTTAILGLPRSGTTLLGQILTTHSEFAGAGEFAGIAAATLHLSNEDTYNFPAFMERHGEPQMAVDFMSDIYHSVAAQRFGETGRLVDKTFLLNRRFGIFKQLAPNAKAIYLRRDVNDVAWSCFKTPFRSGHPWSWHPQSIAEYIKSEHKLLEHWQSVYGDEILVIDYEQLVSEPKEMLVKICSHIGVEFEPSMLDFHRSSHPVLTSSLGQVHRELNDNAVKRSQNYERFVQAFRHYYDK